MKCSCITFPCFWNTKKIQSFCFSFFGISLSTNKLFRFSFPKKIGKARLPQPRERGTLYNYLRSSGVSNDEGDEEDCQPLVLTEPKTPKQAVEKKEMSPITPYQAHQKLKRTKQQRRIEKKRSTFQKRLSSLTSSNTLFNSGVTYSRNGFETIISPLPS